MNKRKKLQGGLDSLFTPQERRAAAGHHAKAAELLQADHNIETEELLQAARPLFRRGRPQKHSTDRPAAERGCKDGEARYTYLMNKAQAEALKDAAYWQRTAVKNVLQQAVADYLAAYEKKNGPLKRRNK